jgi:hypothetical protein
MSTAKISIEVDSDAARAFQSASAEDRRKLEVLLALRLKELTTQSSRPLTKVMDVMSAKAATRGLTPEILNSLLNDE